MAVRASTLVKRCLIFVHRWLGVALSVLFLLWFASGIVMMYWGYPEVTARDRLERAPVLEPEDVRLSPEAAAMVLGRVGDTTQVRLTSFDRRPVYVVGRGGGRGGLPQMVFADDGTTPADVDDALLDRVAESWAGRPVREAAKESLEEPDQWTVGALRTVRPLYKYVWPDGQHVYVNGSTAEVVQFTTTESRVWGYLGAVTHWLYFTPLRKHGPRWSSLVIWSSLIGTVSAVIGVVIAVWMLSPRKRYRHAGATTSIPYRGWKRWHTIIGLAFGVIVTTWTFSGLLSMGPFPIMDRLTELTVPTDAPRAQGRGAGSAASGNSQAAGASTGRGRGGGRGGAIAAALGGRDELALADFRAKPPADALASVRDFRAKELELRTFAGKPVYLATDREGRTRIIPVHGEPVDAFDHDAVMRLVREAAGPALADIRLMSQYDAYYLDRRRERPLPVIYAQMNDAVGTRYYIDPKTARVVGAYSARGWVNRWLYHGLHSLDFPWLYNHRPLWDIVVITLMLGGTALCVTSMVLAWRVMARTLAAAVRARFSAPNDDLALESDG